MMTDKECRLMKIAMDASEVSIAALQMATLKREKQKAGF